MSTWYNLPQLRFQVFNSYMYVYTHMWDKCIYYICIYEFGFIIVNYIGGHCVGVINVVYFIYLLVHFLANLNVPIKIEFKNWMQRGLTI